MNKETDSSKISKSLDDFNEFLSTIDLESNRERFRKYKSVEEDLPREIQILGNIYKTYWSEPNFLSYDQFIHTVINDIESKLRAYNRKRNGDDPDSEDAYPLFLKGWIARQYRTWTSILTQIQLGYVAKTKFPNNEVTMSEELDIKGIDLRIVDYNDFGVKKVTKRTDIKISGQEKEGVIPIKYCVPSSFVLQNPKTKKGTYRKPYMEFKSDKRLDYLPNGFIIFTDKVFDEIGK